MRVLSIYFLKNRGVSRRCSTTARNTDRFFAGISATHARQHSSLPVHIRYVTDYTLQDQKQNGCPGIVLDFVIEDTSAGFFRAAK